MRIDAYNQVSQIYQANKATKTKGAVGVGARDQVQISRTGQEFQIAKQAVAAASDIREDKVAELKASINSGTYSVDSGDFASKLLEQYNAKY